MWDAEIGTLYKNKGDNGDCNTYKEISLLSVVGKIFTRVLLKSYPARDSLDLGSVDQRLT